MTRLVSKLELSRRVSGRKKSSIYKDCEEGGQLHAAMVGDRVDLDHQAAKMYCAQWGYAEPDMAAVRKEAASKSKAPRVTEPKRDELDIVDYGYVDDSDEKSSTDIMSMTLREVVKRYGKGIEFKEYTMAYHKLVQTQGLEEDQARKRGEFIHRVHAERLIAMVDSLHKALLSDAVTNIANSAMSLAMAGADRAAIESAAREPIERTIKSVKAQITRALRDL